MIVPVLNTDFLRRDLAPAQAAELGAAIIRVPMWPNANPADCDPFAQLGIGRWGVPVPQSCDWADPYAVDELFRDWAPRLSHVSGWNEPEGEGEASSTLDPAECGRRARMVCQFARRHNPDIVLIAPEIARQPEYLHSIDLTPYASLSAHIYGAVEDVPYYLPRFPGDKKIWVGETFCPELEADGRLPALWRALIADPRVRAIAPWWHSPPDAPGLGMQGDDKRIAAFRALARIGGGSDVGTVTAAEMWAARWQTYRRQATYRHEFGIPSAWRANAEAWGYPLWDDEQAVEDGDAVRQGMLFHRVGLVVWTDAGHRVVGWPAA